MIILEPKEPIEPILRTGTTTVDPTLALRQTVSTLTTQNQAQAYSLTLKDQEIAALKTEVGRLTQQAPVIASLTQQRDSLQAQVQNLNRLNTEANTRINGLQTDLTALRSQVNGLQQVAAQNAALQKEIAALKAGQGVQVSLSSLISETGRQLEDVQQRLKDEGRNFRLGRISMDLKVLPTGTGTDLSFMRREDVGAVDPNQLSTIKIDFSPTGVAAAAEAKPVSPPNVIGYTLIMARRKLAEAGFPVQVSYQAIAAEAGKPNESGRVVDQWPKPQESVAPGTQVSIAIGKPTMLPAG